MAGLTAGSLARHAGGLASGRLLHAPDAAGGICHFISRASTAENHNEEAGHPGTTHSSLSGRRTVRFGTALCHRSLIWL